MIDNLCKYYNIYLLNIRTLGNYCHRVQILFYRLLNKSKNQQCVNVDPNSLNRVPGQGDVLGSISSTIDFFFFINT